MRINSPAASYPVEPGSRPSTAAAPRHDAAQGENGGEAQTTAAAVKTALEPSQSQATDGKLVVPTRSGSDPSTLNSRAAKAIASYSSTAAYSLDTDASQILGLDLYA
jgi:hypothetical protein